MLKRSLFGAFIIALFFLCLEPIKAYDFINPKNENSVLEKVNEIYILRDQYESFTGGYTQELDFKSASSNTYWWPIGSIETTEYNGKLFAVGVPETVHISSNYGYRDDPFNRGKRLHTGTDISGGRGLGYVNIIAARDGVVVYPNKNSKVDCPSGNTLSSCGNGYGNYVIIQHTDGNYTLYGHMYENSITVTAGESVRQGQVIGKMGSSGNSTGAHLHFEVREGQNAYSAAVDALNYISVENTRSAFSTDTFLIWLNNWNKYTTLENDNYLVETINSKRVVGPQISLDDNSDIFLKYGVDVKNYSNGDKILSSIVNKVELDMINSRRGYVENLLATNNIILEENQIEALISILYSEGNIEGFAENYKQFGNTNEFYNNWFSKISSQESISRRNAEWVLFNSSKYIYNG